MILHIIPYEKMYLSITMDIDESMSILNTLKQLKSENQAVEKLKSLLDSGLSKAIQYGDAKVK